MKHYRKSAYRRTTYRRPVIQKETFFRRSAYKKQLIEEQLFGEFYGRTDNKMKILPRTACRRIVLQKLQKNNL